MAGERHRQDMLCVNPPLETVYWPLQAEVYSKAVRCMENATHVKVKVTEAGKLMLSCGVLL